MQNILMLGLILSFLLATMFLSHYTARQDVLDRCDSSPVECFRLADAEKARVAAEKSQAEAEAEQRRSFLRAQPWAALSLEDKMLKAEAFVGPITYAVMLIALLAVTFTVMKRRRF